MFFRYGGFNTLSDAVPHLVKNDLSFLIGRQTDHKGTRRSWLYSDYNEYFKSLAARTSYFSRNYPHLFEVIPETRNVKVYIDVEWNLKEGDATKEETFSILKTSFENYILDNFGGTHNISFFWAHSIYNQKASYHLVVNGFSCRSKNNV